MNNPPKSFYEFGPFRLDLTQRILLHSGQHIPLTIKAYETLLVLVENCGRILEKEELLNLIWPDAFVEEVTLAKNISTLRKVLAQSDGSEEYIETIPKRGYRFVGQVKKSDYQKAHLIEQESAHEEVAKHSTTAPPIAISKAGAGSRVSWSGIGVMALLLIGVAPAVTYWRITKQNQQQAITPIKSLAVLPFRCLGIEKDEEYWGQGLTDILITRLGGFRELIVRPTSAVLRYSGETQNAAVAGRELKADAVLEGSVQKFGERLRVSGLQTSRWDH